MTKPKTVAAFPEAVATLTTVEVQVPDPHAEVKQLKAEAKAGKAAVKAKKATKAEQEEMSAQQWLARGQELAMNVKNSSFAVGDWWAAGEPYSHRPEADKLFAGMYTRRTLQQFGYVAANVPASVRTDELSFMHHSVVASLPEDEQRRLLDKAVDEDLTVAALRSVVQGERGPVEQQGDAGLDLREDETPEPESDFNQHAYLGDVRKLLAVKKYSRLDESGRAELATFLDRLAGKLAK